MRSAAFYRANKPEERRGKQKTTNKWQTLKQEGAVTTFTNRPAFVTVPVCIFSACNV